MEHARLPGILLPALMLAGCSSFSRYVISNNSDEIAVIAYSYPPYISRSDNRSICPIRPVGALPATTLDELSNETITWQRLALDKFVFNEFECSIRVAIVAGASVTFAARDPIRQKKTATSLVDVDLIQLNIQNENQNVFLTGVRKFKRLDDYTDVVGRATQDAKAERNGEKLYVYDFP